MWIFRTKSFKRDYRNLTQALQRRVDKQLELFVQNPRHPSLQVKKMEGKWGEDGIFEARVTQGYRFTFKIDGEHYTLRRVGPHDILSSP